MARRDEVTAAVHGAGYRYVTLDLDGFRSGNLNDGPGSTVQVDRAGGGPVIGVRVKLTFPEELVREPIIARMVKELRHRPQHPPGRRGRARRVDHLRARRRRRATVDRAVEWLRDEGVQVDLLGDVVES